MRVERTSASSSSGLFAFFFFCFFFFLPPTNTLFPLEVGSLFLSYSAPKVHITSVPRLETEKEGQKTVRRGRSKLRNEIGLLSEIIVVVVIALAVREKKQNNLQLSLFSPWRRCRRGRRREPCTPRNRKSWLHLGTGGRPGPCRF